MTESEPDDTQITPYEAKRFREHERERKRKKKPRSRKAKSARPFSVEGQASSNSRDNITK